MRFSSREVFRALGDPHRLRMLELLSGGPLPAGRIARRFRMTQPAVSHHLAVLRRAGCVTDTKKGKEVFYQINDCCLTECCAGLLRRLRLKRGTHGR